MKPPAVFLPLCSVFVIGAIANAAEVSPQRIAQQILAETGVRGGVIVHVGCGNGQVTAAQRANGRLYVSTLGGEVICLMGEQ